MWRYGGGEVMWVVDGPRTPGPPDGAGDGGDTRVVDVQRVPDRPDWWEQYAKDRRVTPEVWDAMSIAPYRERLDNPDRLRPDGTADTPREALDRFDPRRAGLDDIDADQATEHIAGADLAKRPWLSTARDATTPEAQRVIAALDRGDGHALQRHEGSIMPDMTEARAAKLVDPAVPNPADRAPGKDAYRSKMHACGIDATALVDPDAFAVAFARAVEHPKARAVLDGSFDAKKARAIDIPLDDLLGPESAQYCAGHRLDPIDGDVRQGGVDNRRARRAGDMPTVPEATAAALGRDDFDGADLHLAFKPNRDRSEYEVAAMYVILRKDEPKGRQS